MNCQPEVSRERNLNNFASRVYFKKLGWLLSPVILNKLLLTITIYRATLMDFKISSEILTTIIKAARASSADKRVSIRSIYEVHMQS